MQPKMWLGFSDRLRPSLLISNQGITARSAAGVASQSGYASSISFWPTAFEQCGTFAAAARDATRPTPAAARYKRG
jgi:hypothetical protein